MAWNVWVCNTHNGLRRYQLPVSAFNWDRLLNAAGYGDATIQLGDKVVGKTQFMDLTSPLKRTWVLSWDDVAVFAGIVWEREYDRDSSTMTVQLGDVWTMLAGRLAIERGASNIAHSKLAPSGLSLETICKRLVEAGLTTPSNDWLLPFTLPADVGGPHTREFFGYDFPTVHDALDEVMKTENGPDLDFQPAWTAGADPQLTWVMRAGSLTTGNWEWNLAAPNSGASKVTWKEDASKVATSMVIRGEGSEKNVLNKRSQTNFLGYAVERAEYLPLKTQGEVDAHSRAALAARQAPIQQFGMSIMAGGHVPVSDLQLGGRVRLYSSGDPVIADGLHINRLIQYSGSLNQPVKLGFQPVGG